MSKEEDFVYPTQEQIERMKARPYRELCDLWQIISTRHSSAKKAEEKEFYKKMLALVETSRDEAKKRETLEKEKHSNENEEQ